MYDPRPSTPPKNKNTLSTLYTVISTTTTTTTMTRLSSCLHMSQSFPPGRFIWCNEGLQGGPTARPAAVRGGHACCKDRDFCNLQLRPVIKYYAPARDRSATIAAAPAGPGGLQTPTLVYEGALWLCTSMSLPPPPPFTHTLCCLLLLTYYKHTSSEFAFALFHGLFVRSFIGTSSPYPINCSC